MGAVPQIAAGRLGEAATVETVVADADIDEDVDVDVDVDDEE
jgi:hypothetical protein